MRKTNKKFYETPRVMQYGNIPEVTQGNEDGSFTDADFPAKTPVDDLTFSD